MVRCATPDGRTETEAGMGRDTPRSAAPLSDLLAHGRARRGHRRGVARLAARAGVDTGEKARRAVLQPEDARVVGIRLERPLQIAREVMRSREIKAEKRAVSVSACVKGEWGNFTFWFAPSWKA